jgi:hypothetical protein
MISANSFVQNCMAFAGIWRNPWASLVGDALITHIQVGLSEVQELPSTFTESNKNIACFIVVGVLKMLAEVACEHLPELWRLVVSSDASLLHEIPKDIGKIVGKVVRRWWTQHGLPYCMQLLKEDNEVSFVPLPLF